MRGKLFTASMAGVVALSLTSPAAAALITFDLSDSGTRINDQTIEFTAGSGYFTTRMRATAWTYRSGTTLQAASLRTWDKGLGVQFDGDGQHTVDNLGSFDFIAFHFSNRVEFEQATLWPFSPATDNDATLAVATINKAYDSGVTLADAAALQAGVRFNVSGTGTSPFTVDLDPQNKYRNGNLWSIGAQYASQDRDDGFKIDVLKVNVVPEPATWAMMIVGFGAVGTAMRTSRRRQTALAAA